MFMPGGYEWLIILFVALLVFGNRLPSLMRSLGGSVREFKRGMDSPVDSGTAKSKDAAPSQGNGDGGTNRPD
jgi:sec-independent protein translocase protein TatA